MTDEAKEFLNILNLKSQLINFDERKLKEMYEDNYENYVLFLNAVGMLINNERRSTFSFNIPNTKW